MTGGNGEGGIFGLRAHGPAYVVAVYSLLGLISLGLFGALHVFSEGIQLVGRLELASAGVLALNIAVLQMARNVALARFVFLLTILVMLFVMLISGGTEGTGIFWFFVFPVSAFFLGGKKEGLWWLSALLLMIAGTMVLVQTSVITIPYTFIEVRQLMVSIFMVSAGIFVYQRSRESLEGETNLSKEALNEQKLRADTILEHINEGVVVTDAAGRVLRMNEAAQGMLGWSVEELVGKQFTEDVPLLDNRGNVIVAEKRPLSQVLRYGKPFSGELVYKRKNGSTFPVAIAITPLEVDGKVRGTIGTLRDITGEREVDRAKSEFVTLASHQLRTPISTINWLSEMLLHGDAGALNSDQQDYIEQVYDSNQRSASMVDAMLLVSTLEIGELRVSPEPTDLASLAHRALHEQIGKQHHNKEFHISETYDPELPQLNLDPTLTSTMLNNLMSNAVKYTPKGGRISVTISRSNRKLSPDSAGSVSIMVSDSGYGIPKGQQNEVFAKLFRAANIKIKDTDGTGLGLYIVKKILEQVGGQIRLESEENKGSAFTIWLPLEGMRPSGGSAAPINREITHV